MNIIHTLRSLARSLAGATIIIIMAGANYAAPAHANTLREIERIGSMVGVIPRGCVGLTGIWKARCYVNDRRMQSQRQEMRERSDARRFRSEMQAQEMVRRELNEACRIGDRWSCDRVARMNTPASQQQIQIMERLENACQRGDRESCRRLGNGR